MLTRSVGAADEGQVGGGWDERTKEEPGRGCWWAEEGELSGLANQGRSGGGDLSHLEPRNPIDSAIINKPASAGICQSL